MESVTELFTNPLVLASLIVGASVVLLMYILKSFQQEAVVDEYSTKNEKGSAQPEKKKVPSQSGKSKKKVVETRWAKNDKQIFSHPWLLASLKGHTGTILDMDFSANGKFLTSCDDEDPDPDGGQTTESSSSSECNKGNSRVPFVEPNPSTRLSRRQRKNRRREDSLPSESLKPNKQKPKKQTETSPTLTKKQIMAVVPLRQFLKFNAPERVFTGLLHNYLLTHEQMMMMGYPMESSLEQNLIFIYMSPHCPMFATPNTVFDVNASEFVPKNRWNAPDSGQGSGSSSDSGETFDGEESSGSSSSDQDAALYFERNRVAVPPSSGEYFSRTCARCTRIYYTSSEAYITKEKCVHHWGRLQHSPGERALYSCCRGKAGSRGCAEGDRHVWNGLRGGMNGLYDDYVCTRPRRSRPPDGNYGVYALDCEMCYTVRGLELAKVTVVGMDGRLVYDSFVKPELDIVDYNTRFSGITPKDMRRGGTKTLREVQNDLMGFINANTILIGHGLENDLRVLKIVHYNIVDTAFSFPHFKGLPFRRSLKNVTSSVLKREIQCGRTGHDSYEDASACMELMLWKVRKDFRRSNVLQL